MGFDIGGAASGAMTGFSVGGPWGALAGGALGGFMGGGSDGGGYSVPQISFNPSGVRTGAGAVSYDKDKNLFTGGLSPELLQMQQGLYGTGTGFLSQLDTFDPDEFGANVTQRLRNLAAPQEEQDRLALENRLFKQGLLTSSPGTDRMQSLLTAQQLADEARVARGFSLGQDVQGNLLTRGLQAYGAGVGLEQLPFQMFGTSLRGGTGAMNASAFNAASILEQRKNEADADAGFLSSALGGLSAFGDIGGGDQSMGTMFDNWFSGTDFSDADLDFFNNYDIG